MALDIKAMREKLAKSQQKSEKKDYSKIYFKPSLGKQKVRIVPWKEDKSNPFIEVELHKYDTFKRYIPTLRNWQESDPILKFRDKVYKDKTSTEDDKKFMTNFTPRIHTFVPVIVRGQEGMGVRLWELNKTNYEAVLAIAAEEDEYGDITDIVAGRDLIVEGYNEVNPKTNKTYIAVNIKPSVKQTPLSTDSDEVETWLNEQQNPLEQYKRYTAEEISGFLEDFLNPKDEDEAEDEAPKKSSAAKATFTKAPAKAPTPQKDEDDEEDTPPAKPAKVAKKTVVVEDDEDEDEAPAKPKAKAKKQEVDDLPFEAEEAEEKPSKKMVVKELEEDDELSEAIPKTAPKAAAAKTAKPAAKAAAKPQPLSISKKFDALYDEDDDE